MTKIDTPQRYITIFQNIQETSTPFHRLVGVALDRIRNGKSKELIQRIRNEKDKAKRNDLKRGLPAICFSGVFTKRNDAALSQHSGIICLDFDGYSSQKQMLAAKTRLMDSQYIYSVFISPSGKGLKALVLVPAEPENHTKYFKALENHFDDEHFDKTSKNVSRVCYESYDPLIHINEEAEVWTKLEEEIHTPLTRHIDRPTIPLTDENKIVDRLVRWWTRKYPMQEGTRNHNTFVLAAALNDFGINKAMAEYVLNQYVSEDFPHSEVKRTIDSAYSHTDKFGTRYYEDEDRVMDVRSQILRGTPKKDIRSTLEGLPVGSEEIDEILERLDEEQASHMFWERTERGAIKIVHILFKHFLEENGFYKYNPEGSKNYVFVRVTNNLIDHTSEKEIKDFILDYLLEVGDVQVYNYFAENTKYFREEFLTLLASIDVYFVADTKEVAYLYYRNCAVKVTGDEVVMIDYIDLGGYVWKDHIIDRNFTLCPVDSCDYKTFIRNICADNDTRVLSMESTIGYLMHGWKNLSYCPAVILNDEVISDNPEGGTGKGIFMSALSQMKKLVVIDGKAFAFEKSFAYQLVSADTQVLCFDDVKRHFDFERLFSVVTEGLTLEKKNKDAIKIPFERSPKIAITTNYAIKGTGNSFERRKWELELHQYYSKEFTPLEEFGRLMFSDWKDEEWCIFDNYMLSCLQLYLNEGLVASAFVNLKVRKLSAETCHEFIEWVGLLDESENSSGIEVNKKLYKPVLYEEFIHENPDYGPRAKFSVSRTRFYKWLNAYSLFLTGVAPDEGRDAQGRWIRFRHKHELEYNTKLNI